MESSNDEKGCEGALGTGWLDGQIKLAIPRMTQIQVRSCDSTASLLTYVVVAV